MTALVEQSKTQLTERTKLDSNAKTENFKTCLNIFLRQGYKELIRKRLISNDTLSDTTKDKQFYKQIAKFCDITFHDFQRYPSSNLLIETDNLFIKTDSLSML